VDQTRLVPGHAETMPEMDGGCDRVVALWEAFGAMKRRFGDNQAQMHNKKSRQ